VVAEGDRVGCFDAAPRRSFPHAGQVSIDALGSVGIQDSHADLVVIQALDGPIRFD